MEAETLRRQTAQAVRAHQRSRGSVPAGWRRWAEEILEATVDWRKALTGAVREAAAWAGCAVDYTYRRPSRRTAALGGRVVLPTLRRPLPRVATVVDTSGSVGGDDLAAALAEISGVLREVGIGGNRVAVLACDADVHAVARVTAVDQVELAGGGGTDMTVGIRAALAAPERPQIVVVLTDGYTPWPPEPVSCRPIAALIGPEAPVPPSWVETVRIDHAGLLTRRPEAGLLTHRRAGYPTHCLFRHPDAPSGGRPDTSSGRHVRRSAPRRAAVRGRQRTREPPAGTRPGAERGADRVNFRLVPVGNLDRGAGVTRVTSPARITVH
ncbi:VWA-like domain-containing protein [Streptomyces sp. NPDC057411]|uniref:vWA domain-containing protein n=1 Tax=unclassified Streptomyces TaxID=2593676 RepID=UPI00362EBA95